MLSIAGMDHYALAQNIPVTIQGLILDAETNLPIKSANVFLSGTTIGASTNAEGKYLIKDSIPRGNYSLVFSHVKYGISTLAIVIQAPQDFTINMLLIPQKSTLDEVTISAKKDRSWERHLKIFKNEFIGTSSTAYNCKILNPWVLSFSKKHDTLYASSSKEIEIENKSLGYKVFCSLKSFYNIGYQTSYKGYYRFQLLKPKNARQEKKWKKRRLRAFNGSLRHFMCALLHERIDKEGFEVYTTTDSPESNSNVPLQYIDPKKLYEQKNNETYISIPDYLKIVYIREREETSYINWRTKATQIARTLAKENTRLQSSWLSIQNKRIKVSDLGSLMDDPTKLHSMGYWAWKRVSDMLPSDFFPQDLLQAIQLSKIQTIKQLRQFTQTRPQEKVYLHQDKSYYAVGDTLWLSAYIVDAVHHKPSDLSKILYVDLIGPDNQVKRQLKLYNSQGKAAGDFTINNEFKPGVYRLRAYTKLMTEFNQRFFFHQRFEIGLLSKKEIQANLTYQSKTKAQNEAVNYTLRLKEGFKAQLANKPLKVVVKSSQKTYDTQQLSINAQGELKGTVAIPTTEKDPYIELVAQSSDPQNKFSKSFYIPIHSYQKKMVFFPEGGDLIAGITNHVGFKALTPQGIGGDVEGTIVDNEGTKVASFRSTHLGMGKFKFSPEKGKSYEAVISQPGGTTQAFPLPKVKEQGYTLHISNASSDLTIITIHSSFKRSRSFNLIGHSRGNPVYTMSGKVKRNQAFTAKILKSSLPGGIIHFTLFDQNFAPRCERLAFIRKNNELDIEIHPNKDEYSSNEKVDVNLRVKSFVHDTLPAHLSIAVVNLDMAPNASYQTSILSNLLLTSDLTGYIENPNYYFQDRKPATLQALDLLMMTQGWRRFTWKEVREAANKKPPTIELERGFRVSGVLKANSGWPVKNGKVTILAPRLQLFSTVQTNDKGAFKFENLPLLNGTKVLIRGTNHKGKPNVKITLDAPPAPMKARQLDSYPRFLSSTATDMDVYLKNQAKQAQLLKALGVNLDEFIELDEVQVTARKIKGKQYSKRPGQLYSRPNFRLHLENTNAGVSAATNFLSYITGKIPGVTVGGDPSTGRIGVFYRGSNRSTLYGKRSVMYLLDGSPVTIDMLENLPLNQIAYVDMISSARAVMYGADAVNGVMAVYLKKDNGSSKRVVKAKKGQLNFIFNEGYYQARQFYVPPYDKENFTKKKLPDLRSTVYWNPLVKVKNGEAHVSFYNPDANSRYQILVEGVSAQGELGRQVYYYLIKD